MTANLEKEIYVPSVTSVLTNKMGEEISVCFSEPMLTLDQVYSVADVDVATENNKKYVSWGSDNLLPYQIEKQIGGDEVLSQCMGFNINTLFGIGPHYTNLDGSAIRDNVMERWLITQNFTKLTLGQAMDLKYWGWCITLIYLNRERKEIKKMRHIDASNCRFAPVDKSGKIPYIVYKDFENQDSKDAQFDYPLLDEEDPLSDLMVRAGLEPDQTTGKNRPEKDTVYALLTKIPMVGNHIYPHQYFYPILKSNWPRIKKGITIAKMAKIENSTQIKYLVEISKDYWRQLYAQEGCLDDMKKQKELNYQKRQEIEQFCTGAENSGKMWISSFYVDPNGHEMQDIKITALDIKKMGGEFSDEIVEATNIMCFSMGVHPNMIGATPGKAQMNNSGSDKRELFTLKQVQEIPYRLMLKNIHTLVLWFNHWNDKYDVTFPMVQLTTLDEHTDAEVVDNSDNDENN